MIRVISLSFLFLFISCSSKVVHKKTSGYEQFLGATLWIQHAAEVRALTYQAYNIARLRIDAILSRNKKDNLALVVDADETIIDNSPFQGKMLLEGKSYSPEDWDDWIKHADAKAIPGSVEFLNYAHSKGVTVFVITNRSVKHFNETYKNLKRLGFPITKKQLIMKTNTSNKAKRRRSVLKNYEIVLLMGDNLNDFTEAFEDKSSRQRHEIAKRFKSEFGRKFIVLPNPMYGDWENALYDYRKDYSEDEKAKLRKELIESY